MLFLKLVKASTLKPCCSSNWFKRPRLNRAVCSAGSPMSPSPLVLVCDEDAMEMRLRRVSKFLLSVPSTGAGVPQDHPCLSNSAKFRPRRVSAPSRDSPAPAYRQVGQGTGADNTPTIHPITLKLHLYLNIYHF